MINYTCSELKLDTGDGRQVVTHVTEIFMMLNTVMF